MTTTTPKRLSQSNPWLIALAVLVGLTVIVGLVNTGNDKLEDPAGFAMGHTLLTIGGVMLAGLLAAGAICWQLRRR